MNHYFLCPAACERNSAAMVAELLNHGVAVNTHCIRGWSALQVAVTLNNVEICEMLLKAGANLKLTNMYGITPLFTAAQTGQVAALRFLLKQGKRTGSSSDCSNANSSSHLIFYCFFWVLMLQLLLLSTANYSWFCSLLTTAYANC